MDSHLFHPLAKVLAISAVAISDQVARHRVPMESMNDLLGGPFRSGAGCYVEMDVASPILSQTRKTYRARKLTVGTVKKSTATRSLMWLFRNVCQVCEGGFF